MYNYGSALMKEEIAKAESTPGAEQKPSTYVPSLHIIVAKYPALAKWAISEAKLKALKQMLMMWEGEQRFEIGEALVYCPGVGY